MFLVKTHFFQWISHVWFFFSQFVLISTPSLFSKNLNPFRGWKNKTSSTSANRSDTEMTLTKGYQCLWSCQTLESSFAAAGGVASIQSCRCHLCDLVGPTLVTLGKVSSAQYFGCNLRWILLSVLVPGMDLMLIRPWFYFHVFVAFQGCQLGSGFGTAGLACTDLSRAEEILFPQAMHVTSCLTCYEICACFFVWTGIWPPNEFTNSWPAWIRLKLKFQADVIGVSAVISACANSAKWVHALSALQMHAVNVPRLQLWDIVDPMTFYSDTFFNVGCVLFHLQLVGHELLVLRLIDCEVFRHQL